MDEELKQHLDGMKAELKAHVSESCYNMETKILTEFAKWGRTSDIRTRQAITDIGLFGERLLNVEDRLTALERGKDAA